MARQRYELAPPTTLPPQKQLFVLEYLKDFDPGRAYQAVRPGAKLMTARVQACNWLAEPEVKEFLQSVVHGRRKRYEVTADRVIQEIARIAFADARGFYNEDGTLKSALQLTAQQSAVVSEIQQDVMVGSGEVRVIRTKYKFHPKVTALDMLARHLGLYQLDNEQVKNRILLLKMPDNGRAGDPGASAGIPDAISVQ